MLFLFALLGPWARRGGGDGALHARLGGRLGLRALLDVHLDVALELADVSIARAGADERADGVGGGLDGHAARHDVGEHGERQRERAPEPGLLLHLSELHGRHAGVDGGGSRLDLIGGRDGAEHAMRVAHLDGERADGEHDARTVGTHGQPLIHLLHQRLDGDALRLRRIDECGERLARGRVEPVTDTRILGLDAAERARDEHQRQNPTSRARSHSSEPSTTSALLGWPKSSLAARGAVGSATHCLPFTRNA